MGYFSFDIKDYDNDALVDLFEQEMHSSLTSKQTQQNLLSIAKTCLDRSHETDDPLERDRYIALAKRSIEHIRSNSAELLKDLEAQYATTAKQLDEIQKQKEILRTACKGLSSVNKISMLSTVINAHSSDQEFPREVMKKMDQLQNIIKKLQSVPFSSLSEVEKRLFRLAAPHIEILDLEESTLTDEQLEELLSQVPNLKSLNLNKNNILIRLPELPKGLEKINFRGCHQLRDIATLQKCKNLNSIESDLFQFDSTDSVAIEKLKHRIEASQGNIDALSTNDQNLLVFAGKYITDLSMDGNALHNEQSARILFYLPNLKVLKLQNNAAITILPSLPRSITTVHFKSCCNLTNTMAIQMCPALTEFVFELTDSDIIREAVKLTCYELTSRNRLSGNGMTKSLSIRYLAGEFSGEDFDLRQRRGENFFPISKEQAKKIIEKKDKINILLSKIHCDTYSHLSKEMKTLLRQCGAYCTELFLGPANGGVDERTVEELEELLSYFPNLTKLHVTANQVIRKFPKLPKSLQELFVAKCEALIKIDSINELQCPKLRRVVVRDCPKVKKNNSNLTTTANVRFSGFSELR